MPLIQVISPVEKDLCVFCILAEALGTSSGSHSECISKAFYREVLSLNFI